MISSLFKDHTSMWRVLKCPCLRYLINHHLPQIVGGLMVVLGISVYSEYHDWSYFYASARSGRFVTLSALAVFLGMVLLVVTSFGFFGSLKQSTCLVNLVRIKKFL